MRERLEEFARNKNQIAVNFAAAFGAKLVSVAGTVAEVGDDYMIMNDIYANVMLIPFGNIACIEIRK